MIENVKSLHFFVSTQDSYLNLPMRTQKSKIRGAIEIVLWQLLEYLRTWRYFTNIMYFLKSPSALLVQRHGRLGRWPNGQRVGIDPDRRSPRNMLYISVGAFSIANSIRVLKSKTEKVLETVKNKGRNKGIHSGRPGFNPIFFIGADR